MCINTTYQWPVAGEKIYHRPDDGFIPVWLEHLRSGWHPRWHMFLKHLCKYKFRCSVMQITPNGVKWMTWFMIACDKMNLQPTFKLFHHLFTFAHSSYKPFYELRFRGAECGFEPGDERPMVLGSSLKNWNREIIMLKGLDLEFMPYIATDGVVTDFRAPALEGEALGQIRDFCDCLGHQVTRDTFMNFKKLCNWGCKCLDLLFLAHLFCYFLLIFD